MKLKSIPLVPSRLAKRAHFEQESIYPILDEALFCTISYVSEGDPFSIPTAFVRYKNKIYIHGSVGSHFILELAKGNPACISITLMDELVIAKSAFHHSINYRSVVIFSRAEKIEDPVLKTDAFRWLTEKMVPGSWDYLRPVKPSEVKMTMALSFDLKEASAKIRIGMPSDDEEDRNLPIWSGLIPFQKGKMNPVPDTLSKDIPIPPHLKMV